MSAAVHEAAGLFGPDSVAWRVDREVIVLAGGSCALLMQAAHPVVAAGVDQHSTYATDPFGRLRRTLTSSFDVVFGTRSRADAAIRRVNAIHAAVRGQLPDGAAYSAADPEALLWVHATLVDTALRIYARFVGPLSSDEERRYLLEAAEVAERLGVLPADLPSEVPELRAWMAGMVETGRVRVTPAARRIARTVLYPNATRAAARLGRRPPRLARHAARSAAPPVRHPLVRGPRARRRAPGGGHPASPAARSRRRCDSCRRRGRRSAGCTSRSAASAPESELDLAAMMGTARSASP